MVCMTEKLLTRWKIVFIYCLWWRIYQLLTKISFDATMKEAVETLASKSKVDIADKNREKRKKLQTFDSSHVIVKGYFDDNGCQNYLIFQPLFKYFTAVVMVLEV